MCQAELYCCAGNSPSLCVHTASWEGQIAQDIWGTSCAFTALCSGGSWGSRAVSQGWSSTCMRVVRDITSFRQLHHGFFSFIENNRFTHSSLTVMTQKEGKYTYKLWCIKPAVIKRVWHEHPYMCTAASAHRTHLFIVYLLFNLFVPHCCLRALCTCQFNL